MAEDRLLPTIAALQTSEAALSLQPAPSSTSIGSVSTRSPIPGSDLGQLEGILSDRSGVGLPNMTISIENGPQTSTDALGQFVLEEAPIGSQLIVVQAPTLGSQFSQHVNIEQDRITYANLVFDSLSMQLGLLSITAPVNNSVLTPEADVPHKQLVYGHCDGLAQIFGEYGKFKIWVLVRAISDDAYLWVQHPAAIVDATNNTWQASVYMGSQQSLPYDGQKWIILAVAAPVESGMENILNVMELEDLPFRIVRSNVISLTMDVK
jgi:hypothetical protein